MNPQDLARLAAELRAMARAAKPHITLDGRHLLSIVIEPPWLDRLHDAADWIDPPADTEGEGY